MSLEETIGKEAENFKGNKISESRPGIIVLQEKQNKIATSYANLQELSGLQKNEVKDFLDTKKIIEKVRREHSGFLVTKGITDKKGIIEAYPEDTDVKAHLEANQKLRLTSKGILEEMRALKEAGVKNVRGKKTEFGVKEAIKSINEEINTKKSQTPEAKRFRENFRRESIIRGKHSIDDLNFIDANTLKEVREYGFKNKEIRQIIKDGFNSEEGIKSLREDYKKLTLTKTEDYRYQEAERKAEKEVKLIEAQLEAKIDLDWAKAEKELFYNENKVGEIENEGKSLKESIKEKEEKYEKAIDKINQTERWKKYKFIFGEEFVPENWEAKLKEINTFDELKLDDKYDQVEEEINNLKKSEPKMFKGKWQIELDKLENKKEELEKEIIKWRRHTSVEDNKEFKKIIDEFEPIIKNLGMTEELTGKEMTIGEFVSFLYEKKWALDRERFPQEKEEILRVWWQLKNNFDRVSNSYKNRSYKNNIF